MGRSRRRVVVAALVLAGLLALAALARLMVRAGYAGALL